MPLSTMLRIHFLQQWFGYSDPVMEKALHDIPLLRQFAGLDAFEDVMPDESTIFRFRHLFEKHDLAVAIFAEVNAVLSEKGLSMKRGTVVDAMLIAAPSSTNNGDKQHDPEMTTTKKPAGSMLTDEQQPDPAADLAGSEDDFAAHIGQGTPTAGPAGKWGRKTPENGGMARKTGPLGLLSRKNLGRERQSGITTSFSPYC